LDRRFYRSISKMHSFIEEIYGHKFDMCWLHYRTEAHAESKLTTCWRYSVTVERGTSHVSETVLVTIWLNEQWIFQADFRYCRWSCVTSFLFLQTEEERHISHMQYLAWPDHGVPDDSAQFLEFTQRVRKARVGMVEPTMVHCSAGIGRTGVLILMETAMCLIEANEPVYPLDIVRAMRDQRAMMIQTAVST